MLLRLYETADLSATPIGVEIRLGTEANQVEQVPVELSDEDCKVHLLNGQLVEFGTNEAFRFWQAPLAGHEPAGGAFLPLDCLHVNPALAARLVIKLLHRSVVNAATGMYNTSFSYSSWEFTLTAWSHYASRP